MNIKYFLLMAFLSLTGVIQAQLHCTPNTPGFTNPVSSVSLPDPSVIWGNDGFFYLYATQDIGLVPIMRSRDLITWEHIGNAFTQESRPRFIDGGGSIWAPDINRIGNHWVLYYSLSKWGEIHKNGIGIAVADSPTGPFRDLGPLFISDEIGVTNSIDQFYIEDEGRKYLFWGSFHGLYGVELAHDGLSVKRNATKLKVAGNAYEAIYIHRKGDYYYLFASVDACCEGVKSTYKLVVGRSTSLFGPYLDKQGRRMLDNHHELVLRSNDHFKGPGHNAEFLTDREGTDWILYHAVNVRDPQGRKLMLDRVEWINGWPVINDGTPSLEISQKPRF